MKLITAVPLWETVEQVLKKLSIELPYYPAVALLTMYLQKTLNGKDTSTPVFIASLYTMAKIWKPPNAHRQMNE